MASSLQAYVSNLRRVLRPPEGDADEMIARRATGYVMSPPGREQVDALEFVELVRRARTAASAGQWPEVNEVGAKALSLWTGDLLEEFGNAEWLQDEATRLTRHLLECLALQVAGCLAANDPVAALITADRLVASDPMQERAHWLRIMALYRNHRPSEALSAYRAHAQRLNDDLALEPGSSLRELHRMILQQDPALDNWPHRELTAPPASGVSSELTHENGSSSHNALPTAGQFNYARHHLIGRQRELAAIARLRQAAMEEQRPAWIMLTGPAGIGKTRLADEVATTSPTGMRVVRIACPDDPDIPPWWPIRAVIRELGGNPDALLTAPTEGDADSVRFLIYERLNLMLRSLGETRTLIIVDDAQWADPASLQWLAYTTASCEPIPVSFLLTIRDDISTASIDHLLGTVARATHSLLLPLTPLTVDEVRDLAAEISGDDISAEQASTLTTQTGGNPFLVGELARLPRAERLTDAVPLAVRSVLRRRLERVDADVLELLQVAAVNGDTLDVDHLSRVMGIDREQIRTLIYRALEEHLIEERPDTGIYALAHGLLKQELLNELSPPHRQQLHAASAAEISRTGTADQLATRAGHLIAARPFVPLDSAFEASRDAALAAAAAYSFESSASWWEHARELHRQLPTNPRQSDTADDLLIAQVEALARAGQPRKVIDIVERHLAIEFDDENWHLIGRLAAVLIRVAGAWPWAVYAVDPARLVRLLSRIEHHVSSEPTCHARVLGALAIGHYYAPDAAQRDAISRRSLETAERSNDDEVIADALVARAVTLSGALLSAADEIATLDRLATLAHPLASADEAFRHCVLALTRFGLGQVDVAEEHLRAGIATSDRLKLGVIRLQMRWMQSTFASWHGDPRRAQELIDRAFQLHEQSGMYVEGLRDLAVVGLNWRSGNLSALSPLPDRNQVLLPFGKPAIRHIVGDTGAIDRIDDVLHQQIPDVWTSTGELVLLADVLLDAGREDQVVEVLRRLRPYSGCLAVFGHVGVIEPVNTAIARIEQHLRTVKGDDGVAA